MCSSDSLLQRAGTEQGDTGDGHPYEVWQLSSCGGVARGLLHHTLWCANRAGCCEVSRKWLFFVSVNQLLGHQMK